MINHVLEDVHYPLSLMSFFSINSIYTLVLLFSDTAGFGFLSSLCYCSLRVLWCIYWLSAVLECSINGTSMAIYSHLQFAIHHGYLILVWVAVIGALSRMRNSVLFQSWNIDVGRMVASILHKVWMWLKAKERNFSVSFFEWVQNLKVCIQML